MELCRAYSTHRLMIFKRSAYALRWYLSPFQGFTKVEFIIVYGVVSPQ